MKYLIFFISLSSFACKYELLTKELNVWGYPVSVESIFDQKLDNKIFSAIYTKKDVDVEVTHEQTQGRFLKSTLVKVNLIKNEEVVHTYEAKKKCIMVNCSVNDFIKTLFKAATSMNKNPNHCYQ